MMTVKQCNIASDLDIFGAELRQAREGKRITLADAAASLKISERYLAALENGCFKDLPAGIYGKKFLREYAEFLKVDAKAALAATETVTGQIRDKDRAQLFSVKKPRLGYILTIPRLLKNALIVSTILACFLYLGICFKKVTAPPVLAIDNPTENLVTDENSLMITGTAEPEAKVTVNGEFVLTDTAGNFSKMINLKTGLNPIVVTAQKQYSRKNIVTRNIVLKEPVL